MGITEKIAAIQDEMAKTQKNKATEYHLGLLKAKLAKYRAELLEPEKKGAKGEGFDVSKAGYGRVALIGFPSVGKSTLLSKLTDTESSIAAYEYTTLTAIPGVLNLDGAKVQLLDLPGIIEGASSGRGRGRQVVAVAKTAELILIMLDATKPAKQKELLEAELEAVGIRLNKKKPEVVVKRKTAGGITITPTVTLTKTDERTIRGVLQSYKIHNADIIIREDITTDDFVDTLLTRSYIPCLYVYNKIDSIPLETLTTLASAPNTLLISCEMDLNLDVLKERIWEGMGLIRVHTYSRKRDIMIEGHGAGGVLEGGVGGVNWDDPLILAKGGTIKEVCLRIHKDLVNHFKYAVVWGKSSKFYPQPQKVGLGHVVAPDDVVSLFTK